MRSSDRLAHRSGRAKSFAVKRSIKSQTLEQLQAELHGWDQPGYRAAQIMEWLYQHLATGWDQMTNLPKALRHRLQSEFAFQPLSLVTGQGAPDATRKFLWRLADGGLIESVLIPANPALYGEGSDRSTLCVSTQVGCAYRCAFCASGLAGWQRDLRTEEIVEQVLAVERWSREQSDQCANAVSVPAAGPPEPSGAARRQSTRAGRAIDNLVIMGMGEPLANYDNVLAALGILNAVWGTGIGARKITLSTSGLVPGIRRLAGEPLQFRLAVSLHGATDAVRARLMPVNRKYPLRELIGACEYYTQRQGRLLTFEYLLIAGVNDGLDQTAPLADLARRVGAKINLIPYNRVEGLPWTRPDEAAQETFRSALAARGVPVTLRREKGEDIDAACGQLRLRTDPAPRSST